MFQAKCGELTPLSDYRLKNLHESGVLTIKPPVAQNQQRGRLPMNAKKDAKMTEIERLEEKLNRLKLKAKAEKQIETISKEASEAIKKLQSEFGITRWSGSRPDALVPEPKWSGIVKICPHCEEVKQVIDGFGITMHRGKQIAQGWCRDCRKSTNYQNKDRVYKTS